MFNWVVKVVPHPPDGRDVLEEDSASANGKPSKRDKLKSKSIREEDQTSQTSQGSVQNGMINWLSNGFASALPQPAGGPLLSRANSDAKSMHEEGSADRTGVIGWISQGMGKVVPQPDEKYRQEETPDCVEATEVYDVKDLPDSEPLPHIPVVEMVSEDEVSEVEAPAQFPPKMMTWIKSGFQNALPQHVVRPPNNSNASTPRSSQCSNKVYSPPPESITSVTDVDLKAASMVTRIVQGLGLSMPQPVLKNKEKREIVRNGSANSVPDDLVLEEVDSEDEAQTKETTANILPSPPPGVQQQTPKSPEQSLPLSVTTSSQAHTEQEDAETQTARWTPMIESIKREAEDTAILIMEERLMQERVEMARMAEDVARKTAEMAVRELAQARLGIQTIVEEPEDYDQECQAASPKEFLPEEQEAEEQTETPVEGFKSSSSLQEEPDLESEPEVDIKPEAESTLGSKSPISEKLCEEEESEEEPDPITHQPQSVSSRSVCGTDTPLDSTPEVESSVPSRCDALKSCLMHVPCIPQALDHFSRFQKENNITLPRVPQMPNLPPSLSQITQQLPSFPFQVAQLPQQISQQISQIPQQFQNLSSNVSQRFPSFTLQLPSLPQQLSNIPQQLSNIPQKLSSLPQRLSELPQQVSTLPQHLSAIPQKISSIPQRISNIRTRFNQLKPEQDAQAATAAE